MADAPKPRIATVKGVWVRPGVSKNRRLYTREHIASSVAEAQRHIAGGGTPITILTHHGARDGHEGDVTRTVGHVTKVGLDEHGNGTFEADVADTQAGHEVAALTTGGHVKGVSMAATWKGEPRTVQTADGPAECADGFSLRGIDFTPSPGVTGAGITSAEMAEGVRAGLICEELEEVTFVDEPSGNDPSEGGDAPGNGTLPYGTVTYADPGYRADKKKRYPLDTAKRVRAANSYINVKANADKYSSTQLKRVKSRIAKAAKKFGIDIATEEAEFTAEVTELLEAYASMSLDNGPGTVRVSAWVNEPEQLAAVGKRIAVAALAGLHALDPDNDGDIDTGTGTQDDTDDDMAPCIQCGAQTPDGAKYCPACGTAVPPAESAPNHEGEPPVGETPATPGSATESAPITMTQEQLDALVAKSTAAAIEAAGVKPNTAVEESEELKAARKLVAEAEVAKTAPAAPATPAAPAESAPAVLTEARLTELLAEREQAAVEAFRAQHVAELRGGLLARRGLVAESQTTEELYGAEDAPEALRKASTSDLNKVADAVVFPLIAAGR